MKVFVSHLSQIKITKNLKVAFVILPRVWQDYEGYSCIFILSPKYIVIIYMCSINQRLHDSISSTVSDLIKTSSNYLSSNRNSACRFSLI